MRTIEEVREELSINKFFMKSFVNNGIILVDKNNMVSDEAFEDFKERLLEAESTVQNALYNETDSSILLTDEDISELDNL